MAGETGEQVAEDDAAVAGAQQSGGYGEVLFYYFSGYGWYAVALASLSGTNLTYDWPAPYYYQY